MPAIIEFDADHEVTIDGDAKSIIEALRDAYGPWAVLKADGEPVYVSPQHVRLVRDS